MVPYKTKMMISYVGPLFPEFQSPRMNLVVDSYTAKWKHLRVGANADETRNDEK